MEIENFEITFEPENGHTSGDQASIQCIKPTMLFLVTCRHI
jgi:hypothetical protein